MGPFLTVVHRPRPGPEGDLLALLPRGHAGPAPRPLRSAIAAPARRA